MPDATTDGIILQTENLKNQARQPQSVAWIPDGRFVTSDGGSRGFTRMDTTGNVTFAVKSKLEWQSVKVGHYPEVSFAHAHRCTVFY